MNECFAWEGWDASDMEFWNWKRRYPVAAMQ